MRRFTSPPQALRKAKLDNLVLVPASLLSHKGQYQAIANELPSGSTLIVLPTSNNRQRQTLENIASGLRAKGKQVMTVNCGRGLKPASHPADQSL